MYLLYLQCNILEPTWKKCKKSIYATQYRHTLYTQYAPYHHNIYKEDWNSLHTVLFVVVKELLIEEMGKKHVLIAMEKGNLSVDIAKKENVYVPVVMELVNRDM